MKLHYTSGYHPSANRQTKRANQTLEQYIQIYCNYQQDNWDELLPLAEFAYDNAPNASIGITLFFANKGYHPRITVHPERDMASTRAHEFVVDLDELHSMLCSEITHAQEHYKETKDQKLLPHPEWKIGDKVMVLAKYIKTT